MEGSDSSDDYEYEFVEKDPTGRYFRYDDVLGRGAYKTVYKAFDEEEGIEVAWSKVKPADDAELERLFSEITLLKSLKHDNIIKLFSWWVSDDDGKGNNKKKKKTVNMITELFTSGSLKQYRKKHTNVEVKAIKKWARQILKGLSYLHSHDPPIIHRDLKCDNVFINGFNGEVKIGDLGFALMRHDLSCGEHEVIGTPEFIAPEMYEEDYTELVDVYSFGMCMLELMTCQYPYRECLTPAQIYKKVTSGVMPDALSKVKDPQVREFIEKCLMPASKRMSAIELLNDPFLAADDSKWRRCFSMEIDSASDRVSSKAASSSSSLECQGFTKNNLLTLRAKRNGCKDISLTLTVAGSRGKQKKKTIEFDFYLDSDTAVSIAVEMVDQGLGLSIEDVSAVAELIDGLVMKIVPNWRPTSSVGAYSSCTSSSAGSTKKSAVSSMEMSSICSLQSELSLVDKHHCDQLTAELSSIDAQYQQRFVELVKKREEAIQSAKKKLVGQV